MIARHKRSVSNPDNQHSADLYLVDDGSQIFEVMVSVTGAISIAHDAGTLDDETMQAITCAVLEQEQKRGF